MRSALLCLLLLPLTVGWPILAAAGLSARLLAFFLQSKSPATAPRELYQKTQYRAALEALKPAQSSAPSDWHLAGLAHFQLGEYQRAQEWFEKAARSEPGKSEHMHWLGRTLGRRAEQASFLTAPRLAVECRKAFEKAVALDPKNTEAWSDLLEYYLSAPGFLGGGFDKAVAAAERIGRLDPVEKFAAQARLAEKKEDWAAAERHWTQAAALAPDNAGRWIDVAKFLARRGRHSESDRAFERASAAAPKTWYARAETYIEHKRNAADARTLLERYLGPSVELTPDDPSRDDARKLLKKISR